MKHSVERQAVYPVKKHPSVRPAEARLRSHALKRYNGGFSNFMAGLMWVQLLQQSSVQPIQEENVSWEFTHLDGITELDPQFDTAYAFGATFLSVIKQDQTGAGLILEKWVKRRPYHWRPNYLLGFYYFDELKDAARGAQYMLRAARMNGAPPWISALGVRILSETGALAQALRQSLELYPGIKDSEGQFRLRRRMRALNFALQRKAWNSALATYREKRGGAPHSLGDLRPYLQSEIRGIASLFQNEIPEEVGDILKETFPFVYDPQRQEIVPAFDANAEGLEDTGVKRRSST